MFHGIESFSSHFVFIVRKRRMKYKQGLAAVQNTLTDGKTFRILFA
ncbi:hypothetical protein B8V81_4253 [Paenibacillus pasadenensis]|uniref:Uncharacterized protein n=1 Tax=Paenibacillus pasadenensis TaxID=217090 RepID=A0A2N5N676_9BACL|nr:hypothetical protein B8V81_4253 [Paenibacillus pasadenensis]